MLSHCLCGEGKNSDCVSKYWLFSSTPWLHSFQYNTILTLFIDIQDEISESCYTGQVYITLKEGSMEPSSIRHATELVANIQNEFSEVKPVFSLYTDDGPDHRIMYLLHSPSFVHRKHFLDWFYHPLTARKSRITLIRNTPQEVQTTYVVSHNCRKWGTSIFEVFQ